MSREGYITLILDLTKRVECQNEDLKKLARETRGLQRDIGNLSNHLDRLFLLVKQSILMVSNMVLEVSSRDDDIDSAFHDHTD